MTPPSPAQPINVGKPPNAGGTLVQPGQTLLLSEVKEGALRAERVSTAIVVILAWPSGHPASHLGGFAHIALPGGTPLADGQATTPTIDTALPELMDKLLTAAKDIDEATADTLQAWLIGGAQLFAFGGGHSTLNVGSRNVTAARQWLASNGIAIAEEAIGGNRGRHVAYMQPQDGGAEHPAEIWVTPLGNAPRRITPQ